MTTTNSHDLLVNWLKSAHAMETSLINMLENQAERATAFADIQSKLYEHREQSQRHADLLKGCIARLGGKVSQVRTGLSKFMGESQSLMLGAFGDSVVRDAIVGAMAEQMEISSYNAIIALAEQLNDEETVRICSEILEEEEEMHEFLNDHLKELVERGYERDLLIT